MIQGSAFILVLILVYLSVTHAEPFDEYLQNEEPDNYKYEGIARADRAERDPIQKESLIVQDVYSPDYYEPNIILDYRYLKSGGREYTRGDGGQILILPRRNQGATAKHNNYDVLLEHLRNKRLAELHKYLRQNSNRKPNGFEMSPGHYEVIGEEVEEEGGYLRTYQHRA